MTKTHLKNNPRSREDDGGDNKKRRSDDDEATKSKPTTGTTAPQKGGLDEIDALFSEKKKRRKDEETKDEKKVDPRSRNSNKKRPRDGSSASASKLQYNRNDLDLFQDSSLPGNTFLSDGLGGKFNKEGYTGRTEQGVKIYKAHTFNKPGFGQTPDCPFDCDCCFI